MPIYVGCAGWTIPKSAADRFPPTGSHLVRYASRFPAVEINSSFYKAHRPATYARWADSVPEGFRFAVKIPKSITHTARLMNAEEELARFLGEVCALGNRLGPLLVQLPPSLSFDAQTAARFFNAFRQKFAGDIVCEPRHPSWFSHDANELLTTLMVARVVADPATAPPAGQPGGWPKIVYHRLHGSPQVYYSDYSGDALAAMAAGVRAAMSAGSQVWVVFDNTALGHATANGLDLLAMLGPPIGDSPSDHHEAAEKAHVDRHR